MIGYGNQYSYKLLFDTGRVVNSKPFRTAALALNAGEGAAVREHDLSARYIDVVILRRLAPTEKPHAVTEIRVKKGPRGATGC